MIKQVRVLVKGDVVGVGFRAWAVIQAKELGIKGWVKNVYNKPEVFGVDGGVEALLQAEERVLDKMIERLKEGPSVARVDEVEVIWEDVGKEEVDFTIMR